jgi:N utilization substance protein A
MDPNTLKAFIKLICKEKDLPAEILKEAIEHAILASSRKQLSLYRDAVVDLDLETGVLNVIVTKAVAEEAPKNDRNLINLKDARGETGRRKINIGEEIRVPIDPSEFGRIAAQSARQMVMQRVRDAERVKIFDEFKDKENIMVTGIVQRFERRDVILNIGRAEAVLPHPEKPMGATYRFNDRIKVMILRVEETPRGPYILVSRKTPQLVIELFKQEVPEIADGTVQIVGIAREAGIRTKIAVKSANSDVDPVGACVGMKGSRVQMVVRELENEKVDIVPWSPAHVTFIQNALNPAKIISIELDEENRRAHVVVAQGNLAIAIGRKGQNTKLAAKLSGFRLDIRSENEDELAYEEIQRRYLEDFLEQIEGLSEWFREALLKSNFNSVDKIAKAEFTKLSPFTGENEELCYNLINGAKEYVNALHEMENERRSKCEDDEDGDPETGEGANETEAPVAELSGEEPVPADETEDSGKEPGSSEQPVEDEAVPDDAEAPVAELSGEEPVQTDETEDIGEESGPVQQKEDEVAMGEVESDPAQVRAKSESDCSNGTLKT